jgi:zinc protease
MDRTNYFETFQATEDNLKWALELEADRMVNSFIAKKDLDSEMTFVRNEFEAGEVEAAKKSWLQSQQVSRAQDRELVNRINNQRFWNRTMAFDSELEKKVMSLTPEQLQAAMRKYVDLSQLSYFCAGDFKKANVNW